MRVGNSEQATVSRSLFVIFLRQTISKCQIFAAQKPISWCAFPSAAKRRGVAPLSLHSLELSQSSKHCLIKVINLFSKPYLWVIADWEISVVGITVSELHYSSKPPCCNFLNGSRIRSTIRRCRIITSAVAVSPGRRAIHSLGVGMQFRSNSIFSS